MLIRRNLAIALGTVALCAPALVACGFDAATDRPNTIANGVSHVEGTVDVLGAVVVSATPGSGTFIATLSNEDRSGPATFDTLGPGDTDVAIEAAEFTPIEIPSGGVVNLAAAGGIGVSGDFSAGNFVSVRVGFANGERATMEIPVVADDGYYAGLDTSTPAATDTAPTETASPTEAPTETAS